MINEIKVGDTIEFYISSNVDRILLKGIVEYKEQLGFITIVNGKQYEINKLIDINIIEHTSNVVDENLYKIKLMKQKYDEMINNYCTQKDISRELMRHHNGGYEMGEYDYPVVFFVGQYCLVIGNGIYKKI
jgi:hypothetical protein